MKVKNNAINIDTLIDIDESREKFVVDGVVCEDIEGNVILSRIKPTRNPKWQPLDWKYIESICGHCNRFEFVMCERQAKDNDTAIKAVFNYRKANDDLIIYLAWVERENRKEKFIRTHLNDLEDDNYERQEVRMNNG